jgi:hypothetical protein
LAVVGNIHYATINDLTWIGNGTSNGGEVLLGACSSDGYCSFMSTPVGLIGKRMSNESIADEVLRGCYEEQDRVDIEFLERQVRN